MQRGTWGALALVGLAIAVRMVGLHTQSLTTDECIELETARQPLAALISAANSFPPLYHLVLKSWCAIDPSPFAGRHLSVLLGVVAVIAVKRLATEAVDARTGWMAGLLAACSPFLVFYSQQGRGYMLYLLLATGAMFFGLRLCRGATWRDRIGFVVCGVLGGYTHYYFAVLLVAIACGVWWVRGLKEAVKELLPLAAMIGLCCLPLVSLLGPDLSYQREIRAPRGMDALTLGYTFFSFESGYTLGPARRELHEPGQAQQQIVQALPVLGLVGAVVAVLWWIGLPALWRQDSGRFWLAVLLVPFGVLAVLCATMGVTYNTRFVVFAWVPYSLVTSTALGRLSVGAFVPLTVALLVIYSTALVQRHRVDRYQNADMHAVAQFLEDREPHPVLVCSGYMAKPLQAYLSPRFTVADMMDAGYTSGSVERAIKQLSETESACWLVYSREFHGDPEGMILQAAKQQRAAALVHQAAGVRVFACEPIP